VDEYYLNEDAGPKVWEASGDIVDVPEGQIDGLKTEGVTAAMIERNADSELKVGDIVVITGHVVPGSIGEMIKASGTRGKVTSLDAVSEDEPVEATSMGDGFVTVDFEGTELAISKNCVSKIELEKTAGPMLLDAPTLTDVSGEPLSEGDEVSNVDTNEKGAVLNVSDGEAMVEWEDGRTESVSGDQLVKVGSCPPDMPKKIEDKVKDEYGKDDPKAYETLWSIRNKGQASIRQSVYPSTYGPDMGEGKYLHIWDNPVQDLGKDSERVEKFNARVQELMGSGMGEDEAQRKANDELPAVASIHTASENWDELAAYLKERGVEICALKGQASVRRADTLVDIPCYFCNGTGQVPDASADNESDDPTSVFHGEGSSTKDCPHCLGRGILKSLDGMKGQASVRKAEVMQGGEFGNNSARQHECHLVDDGTMDTVISCNGQEYCFSDVNRNPDGSIPEDELQRLYEEAMESFEESNPVDNPFSHPPDEVSLPSIPRP
jgi:hypothetical protein